jgi:predicted nucleic acid-binding protein
VAVAVFDADVLIAFLTRGDAHHERARERVRASLAPGVERRICAVTLSEILVGPIRAGRAEVVEQMLARLSIETGHVDPALARSAATVRARTGLRLPDAYVLATAIQAERQGKEEVRIETFDRSLARARARLRADEVT